MLRGAEEETKIILRRKAKKSDRKSFQRRIKRAEHAPVPGRRVCSTTILRDRELEERIILGASASTGQGQVQRSTAQTNQGISSIESAVVAALGIAQQIAATSRRGRKRKGGVSRWPAVQPRQIP